MYRERKKNIVPKRVIYINLEKKRIARPKNGWQDSVRAGGRIVDGEMWQEKVYNRD
jgi:hypothetical protein